MVRAKRQKDSTFYYSNLNWLNPGADALGIIPDLTLGHLRTHRWRLIRELSALEIQNSLCRQSARGPPYQRLWLSQTMTWNMWRIRRPRETRPSRPRPTHTTQLPKRKVVWKYRFEFVLAFHGILLCVVAPISHPFFYHPQFLGHTCHIWSQQLNFIRQAIEDGLLLVDAASCWVILASREVILAFCWA